MKKFCKLVTVILIFMFFSTGCADTAGRNNNREIVVWSHFTDPEITELRTLADKWSKTSGYKVVIHSDKGDNRAYIEASLRNMEPDIEFGVSHERMEKLHSENLLTKIPDNLIDKDKYIPSALETVTFNNKMYGIPLSIETYGLYYNKDKVKKLPRPLKN